MSLPNNLGRLSAGLTADASLNIGVGVTPSGTYKFEVGTTSKFTGVATFGSTLSNGTYTYTLPSATGTLALTSALSGYLPLTGGTLTGALGGTSASFSSTLLATGTGSNTILGGTGLKVTSSNTGLYLNFSPSFTGGLEAEIASSENGLRIVAAGSGVNTMRFLTSNSSGVSTLALSINGTQAATFSSSVTATQFNAFNDRNYLARGSFRLTSSTNNASALDISVGDNTTYINGNYYGGGNDNTIIIGTYANLSNQLVLKPSGNIGIGTASPGSKLEVSGTGYFSGTISTGGGVSASGTISSANLSVSQVLYATNLTTFNYAYNVEVTVPNALNAGSTTAEIRMYMIWATGFGDAVHGGGRIWLMIMNGNGTDYSSTELLGRDTAGGSGLAISRTAVNKITVSSNGYGYIKSISCMQLITN
jgi:hypothetical protein